MKKSKYWIAATCLLALMYACGGKKEGNSEEYIANAPTTTPANVDPIVRGEELVKGSDCKTCHHKTNTIVGPPHLEVAKKYEFTESNVKMLANKIIKGGSGVWGQVPMAGHADISQADAEMMARYVLSLDGEKEH